MKKMTHIYAAKSFCIVIKKKMFLKIAGEKEKRERWGVEGAWMEDLWVIFSCAFSTRLQDQSC